MQTKTSFANSFKKNLKIVGMQIQKGLQAFSNNIFVKSLVSGFVSVMPVILVASIFILIYSIPEAISPDYLAAEKDNFFNHFKAFCVRTYQFTYGILGCLVTGNIARAMMEELNLKLPYNIRVKSYNLLITGIIIYLIMAAIPFMNDVANNNNFDMTIDSWFDGIFWTQLGAQGILPGIVIGLTTPWIFYWCYKYNITIRMPKAVPGVISQSFLSIIPLAISIIIWSLISYGFILGLGEPFVPWFFNKLGGFIPKPIDVDEFNKLPELQQEEAISNALSAFSNSYGIIALYKFLECFSWFIGVHPEAIQGVFESIMAVNQEMNLKLAELGRPESFAFVNSLMGPTGGMGGTGATFVVPIICLLFCKSEQLKVAGKTSVVPTSFQVNEPILFGAPIILNPYYFVPFITVPLVNSIFAKVFVDNFGLIATKIDIPWATPWFIRGPLAHNAQPLIFALLAVCFAFSFIVWLPFVLFHDRVLVLEEMNKVGKENYISLSGIQYQLNKSFNYDTASSIKYKRDYKALKKENKINKLPEGVFESKKATLKTTYLENSKLNLIALFTKIKEQKVIKENSRYQDIINLVDNKFNINQEKMNHKIEVIEQKIENLKEFEKMVNTSYQEKIDKLNKKIPTEPKKFKLNRDCKGVHENKLYKINYQYQIQVLKIKKSKATNELERNLLQKEIEDLKRKYKEHFENYKLNVHKNNIETANKMLESYQNPFSLEVPKNTEEIKETKEETIVKKDIDLNKEYNVLVLCIGAGTSAMLANAIKEGAKSQSEYKIKANALAYDSYKDALKDTDLIITSPQLRSYLPSIEQDAKAFGIKVVPTKGKQYIDLTNDTKQAFEFTINNLFNNNQEENGDVKVDSNSNVSNENLTVDSPIVEPTVKQENNVETNKSNNKNYNILVLCIGAGTSAMLANAIKEGAKGQSEYKINANALAYDSYKDALKDTDLIITSPQLRSYLSSIEQDAKAFGIKVVPTKGKQYIDLTNNTQQAFEFVIENIKDIKK